MTSLFFKKKKLQRFKVVFQNMKSCFKIQLTQIIIFKKSIHSCNVLKKLTH